MTNRRAINIQQIRGDIARRKAMPGFGPDTSIERLRTVQETQRSFTPEIVEALLDELKVVTHAAAVDHEAACSLAEENEELKRKLASLGTEPRRNPVLAYADSYRDMAKQGVESIPVWNVITDLERNIAPLYTAPVELTDEQIDAVLDSHGNIAYVIADKRERLRMFAREILRAAMLQPVDIQEIPSGWRWTLLPPDSQE
ncbi:Uncharacterised protein [Citrobacter koseri]|uniref:Uncharacterized protein n=1 Tax=Citrobacter koseri TaxID=545 RepID=A0A447UW75_CITKO|nr:Uncharacterised protein [Citrobacter koseri]